MRLFSPRRHKGHRGAPRKRPERDEEAKNLFSRRGAETRTFINGIRLFLSPVYFPPLFSLVAFRRFGENPLYALLPVGRGFGAHRTRCSRKQHGERNHRIQTSAEI